MQNVFHAGFGAFHAGFIEKEGEIWYFQGGHSTDIVLVCTNDTRMDGGLGLTITGMRNVTITGSNAKGSMLVWNTAGRPEPAAQPAFTDITDPDTAQAAQWAAETGLMTPKSADLFKPEKSVTRWKAVRSWKRVTNQNT